MFSASTESSLSVFIRISAVKSPDEIYGLGERDKSLFETCLSNQSLSLADCLMIVWSSSTFSFYKHKIKKGCKIWIIVKPSSILHVVELFPTLEVSCDHVVGRLIYTDLVPVVQKVESCYPKSNSVANAISLINNWGQKCKLVVKSYGINAARIIWKEGIFNNEGRHSFKTSKLLHKVNRQQRDYSNLHRTEITFFL